MAKNNNNFLQSDIWRKFQEAVGHKTFTLKEDEFLASIIEHQLPMVGKYFYVPRGPVCHLERIRQLAEESKDLIGLDSSTTLGMTNIINLAKKNKAGWIRIEPENAEALKIIKNNTNYKIVKAPHDMQPREILVMNINKTEEELLANMKSKTRYNINLAQKRGVSVQVISNFQIPISNKIPNSNDQISKYISEFIRLVRLTEKRKDISFHPGNYYQKMLEVIPDDILKLYVAEYENKVIAANLVVFYGETATYLHGATDDEYRNVMAPYLLQWQAIKDAKEMGCRFYDFGGISTNYESNTNIRITNKWNGITKFKTGFAPVTEPKKFPGSYDLVINAQKYFIYRFFSRLRSIF